MIERRYLQLDVFADRPGSGNPLGVVLDAGGLDRDAMQAFAAWANLSETIFFVPPTTTDADYSIRIFTPRRELPFAGHPSVGAAWAAADSGLAPDGEHLMQECAAGLLPVHVESRGGSRHIHVRSPRASPIGTIGRYRADLAAVLAGVPLGEQAPALWDNGPRWWLVELSSAAEVRMLRPNLPAIAELTRASGAVGLAVFGRALAADDYDLAVRAFCPADGIPEDPVTGSANACIAAMLHGAGVKLGIGGRYIASQGRELGRNGRVEVRADADDEVWIGGEVQAVVRGSVFF